MKDAGKMLEWTAKCTWNPNHKQYIVPEGCEVHPSGEYWHRTGDLGNGVQEAEIVKALRLVVGIDNCPKDRLRIFPRMPYSWTEISTSEYPFWVEKGGNVDQGSLAYTLKRTASGMTMAVKANRPLPALEMRVGPFAKYMSSAKVTIDGKPVQAKPEQSGDSYWVRFKVAAGGMSHKIVVE